MNGYDEEYHTAVNLQLDEIARLTNKLQDFKSEYLMRLYREHVKTGTTPEEIVQSWLSSVWSMCHYGGKGYLFNITPIDCEPVAESIAKPIAIKEAINKIHYVGCSCHIWPCHWNVRSEKLAAFKNTITPEVTKAFQALGIKINLSSSDTFHAWND